MSTSKMTIERKGGMTVNPYGRLVSLPVHSENVFHFPEGLPAFEHVKEFIFLCKPDSRPFFFMHALEPADLAFVCIDPFLILPDYTPKISESDVKFLHLDSPEEAFISNIVTVTRDMRDITVNLQGPVVVNIRASIGKQIICEGQKYPVRFRIWDALNKLELETTEEMAEKKEVVTSNVPG